MEVAALGLKIEGADGIEKTASALDKLSTSAQKTETSTDALNASQKAMTDMQAKLLAALAKLDTSVQSVAKSVGENATANKMAAAAIGTMSAATVDASKSTDALKGVNEKLVKSIDDLGKSSRGVKPPLEDVGNAAEKSSNKLAFLHSTATRVFAAIGAAVGVNALRNYADAWSDLQSKVGSSLGEMSAASGMMSRVAEIANSSYSPLQQTADVFSRNVATFRDLGRSANEAADFTEAVNHALVTTATRGQNAEVVIGSLSRALATGRLDAQGFDTIVSRSPRVLKAMADQLGVNVSSLRELAVQGKVTSDVIANGFVNSLEDLRKEAALMPATITDAFVRVNNNFTAFVGAADQATGASSAFAESVLSLADGLSSLTNSAGFMDKLAKAAGYAGDAVKALALAAGVLLVARLGAATYALGVKTVAAIADAAAMGRAGVASLAGAAANTSLAASATAASRAMALMGGPVGLLITGVAAASLALFDFGGKAKEAAAQADLLGISFEKMGEKSALAAQLDLKEGLGKSEKAAEDAAIAVVALQKDYDALAAQLGRGVTEAGLQNVRDEIVRAERDLEKATDQAEKFRIRLGEVATYLANIGNQPSVADVAADKFKTATDKWLKQYATQTERLEATLAQAREEGGGRIDPEVEKRIRASFAKSGGSSSAKDPAGAAYIAQLNERIALIGKETEYEQLLAKVRIGSIKFATEGMKEEALAQAQVLDFVKEQEEVYKKIESQRARFSETGADKFILGDVSPLSGGQFDEQFARYEAEAVAEQERYAQAQERLKEARENQYKTNKSYDELEYAAKQQHDARMAQIDSAKTSLMLTNASNGFGALASIMKQSQGEQSGIYRAMFAASKAFAVANTTINAYDAISKAWASAPFPANLAAVAATTPQVLAVVSAVSSTGLSGMAHDGIDSVPQTGTWLLEKGERVTTANTSARLDSVLDRIDSRQRGGVMNQSVNQAPIVNVIEDRSRAGQTSTTQDAAGRYTTDVFVANIRNGGDEALALESYYGLTRRGT